MNSERISPFWVNGYQPFSADGYSYTIPSDLPYEVVARIDPFRRWNWGALGGIKMVIAHHYTLSLQYYESIKKVQKQCNLRNFGYQLSIGYQF